MTSLPAAANELRLTRVYDAPVQAVWDAWTIPEQIEKWWGPRGFRVTTHRKDLRPGGTWRYTMHGPDGVDYPNIATYHAVEPLKRLVYDHGATDHTPPLFHVTAEFAEASGKTTLTLTFRLETPEAATQMAQHIRQAGGNATWDRLAEHLAETCDGEVLFVINRTLPAPIQQVFAVWVDPAQLSQWLPPGGAEMRVEPPEIAVGRPVQFVMSGGHGTVRVKVHYLEIDPPRRIVYTQQFVDAQGALAAAPGATDWPDTLVNTVDFAPEAGGQTRITLTTRAHGTPSADQVAAFVAERGGMTAGWTGSLDGLEAVLEAMPA